MKSEEQDVLACCWLPGTENPVCIHSFSTKHRVSKGNENDLFELFNTWHCQRQKAYLCHQYTWLCADSKLCFHCNTVDRIYCFSCPLFFLVSRECLLPNDTNAAQTYRNVQESAKAILICKLLRIKMYIISVYYAYFIFS